MHELLAQLETHVRMAWRYRWVGFAAALAVCLVGWAVVLLMPNQYGVSAKVYLDTSTMLTPVLRGIALDQNVRLSTILMIRRTLLTRPNLEAISRAADLDLKTRTPSEFDELLEGLAKHISLVETRDSNIYDIAYEDDNPQVAHRVVEAVLNLFVERSLGATRKDSGTTREFLTQQIKEYEARLVEAEDRVKRFKQENMGLARGAEDSYVGRQEALRAQIQAAALQLQEAERRAESLKRQVEGDEPTFGLGPPEATFSTVATSVDGRIQALESNLDQLLVQYTERHPDVMSTRRLLAELQATRQSELAKLPKADGSPSEYRLAENPVYQQLKIALGASEAEVAALRVRVEEFKRREQDLGRLADRALEVEAEEARLNRDYAVTKQNYDQLISRLEALNLADQAAKTGEGFKFNIVDPPRVPNKPTSPDRPILGAVVLGMGLGGGAGFAWLFGMLRPAVYSREGLAELSDVPVLGSISRVMSRSEVTHHRLRVLLFIGGCVVLLATFGLIVVFEPQLVTAVDRVRDVVMESL
jgi:polysaccharide chain length determinant protein (PEP-CTERM system associated)